VPEARDCVAALGAQLRMLKAPILEFDRRIMAWRRSNEMSQRLDEIPGVGPARATALVASVANPKAFRSGRDISGLDWAGAQAKLQWWRNNIRCWAALASEALRPIEFRLDQRSRLQCSNTSCATGPVSTSTPIDINSGWARWAVKALPAYREEVLLKWRPCRSNHLSRSPIELSVTKC
jgi:hypothetical protein